MKEFKNNGETLELGLRVCLVQFESQVCHRVGTLPPMHLRIPQFLEAAHEQEVIWIFDCSSGYSRC